MDNSRKLLGDEQGGVSREWWGYVHAGRQCLDLPVYQYMFDESAGSYKRKTILEFGARSSIAM